ncbi:MAG: gluconeogenesis factor YvcK family protein [bacterium]
MSQRVKNIVTVGGGTGSYTILSGLKNISGISISAIVSMADSGGANAMLRDELGVLPPSDVRQCLVALSEHTEIIRKLMVYRFNEGTLKGHNFGSIFLAALEKVTGDFAQGVEIASEILKVKGTVIPVTRDKADLVVTLLNGTTLNGEHTIDEADLQESSVKEISFKNNVELNKTAKDAILKADFIILGPADFYTSLLPNLIVKGFQEAILKSKAKIILPVNLTNKQGHTLNWKVSDYVKNTESYLGRPVDIILVNTEPLNDEQKINYKIDNDSGTLIKDDLNDPRLVRESLLSHEFFVNSKGDTMKRSFIRHDSEKLAKAIEKIIKQ